MAIGMNGYSIRGMFEDSNIDISSPIPREFDFDFIEFIENGKDFNFQCNTI